MSKAHASSKLNLSNAEARLRSSKNTIGCTLLQPIVFILPGLKAKNINQKAGNQPTKNKTQLLP